MNLTDGTSLNLQSSGAQLDPGTFHERGPLRSLGPALRLLAALLFVLVIPQLASQVAGSIAPRLARFDPDNAFAWLSVHHLAQIIVALVVMLAWSGSSLRRWGFNFNELKVSLRWFGWFALFCTLGTLVFQILPMLLFRRFQPQFPLNPFPLNARNVVGSLGFQYLLSGSGEEPLFRGFVMTVLLVSWKRELRVGKIVMPVAGLWATLLFMLAHVNYTLSPFRITHFSLPQQLFCLGFGLFDAAAFYRTRSLLCPVLAHGFSNGIIWSLLYLTVAFTSGQPLSQEVLGRAGLAPNPPVASQEVLVSYDARGGPLAGAKQLSLHHGHNGWKEAGDQPMTSAGVERWQVKLKLPPAAGEFDFAFTDGSRWDNNSGRDWRVPTRSTSSKRAQESGDANARDR